MVDQAISSNVVDPGLKNQYLKVLRRVSPVYGILPKSYHLNGVTLSDDIAYASGRFADIWQAQLDGRQVAVRAFRAKVEPDLSDIKRVRDTVSDESP